jgi:ArsR family transcriptional regulator, arsenate/arsenite/antimonite-responsive transcriptional repressor
MSTRLTHVEALFKALADATRLRILALLVGGEICVCEIHEALKLPQPTVSRHLAYLRRAGLVETRREGLWIHYRLASLDDTVLRTLTDIVKHALTHVDTIAKDGERLRKATGCCLKAVEAPRSLACCGEEVPA